MSEQSLSQAEVGLGITNDKLDTAGANLPRRQFLTDMPDKGLFALAATLGFFGILISKLNGFDPNYIAATAVALMLAYGGLAYQMPKVQMRIDRLGDNFYYLGFICTLASLSAALIQLREGTSVDALLGSFGIALFTTIVGVSGRVIFVQMRGELDDVEERVRRDLLLASADLRAQLSLSLTEFETFHTAVTQAAAHVREQSPELASNAVDRIARVAAQAARRIDEAFGAEESRAQALQDAMSKISNTAGETTQKLAGEMDRFVQQEESRAQALQDAMSKISNTAGETTQKLAGEMDRFVQQLEALLERLGTAIERIDRRNPRRWCWPFRRR